MVLVVQYFYKLKAMINISNHVKLTIYMFIISLIIRHEKSYFMYGFFGGIRHTDLKYENYKTSENLELTMNRPLLGFHFSTEVWGFTISWTQAENRKPTLIYEIKFRNSRGIVLQIGRSNRGPINRVKSDFYFNVGYEVFR
ncbi:MAG: hypothetical protein KAT74_12505 [Candidatus Cloacimonetes bacterium]|nr:hypothetical protein [Candidatus Cloacimonadota bacterium]